ncbi:hypothetical protein INT48_005722 [Thamnidium elegans]|uniref:Uncharacterized protein n=1 Tax=Thamnidium elegans TaxID=101142 RepID=A0A8H7VZ21_9FUNG|nr:hypothetical protein INT48_005722 [Thamnidium elegans]
MEFALRYFGLNTVYRAVIDTAPLNQGAMNNPSAAEIEAAVNQLKDLLIFAIVQTQNNNWIFITQVEVYYHDRRIDDVAQVDEKNDYSDILTVNMERCQEGRRLWYELCFWCQKLEIVVTGGYYNYENSTAIYEELSEVEYLALENKITKLEYWKNLGFEDIVAKEDILARLEQLKITKERRLSKSKKLLVELISTRQLNTNNITLMNLYNG